MTNKLRINSQYQLAAMVKKWKDSISNPSGITGLLDNEAAHGQEDDIMKAVLQWIASGACHNPIAAAKLAHSMALVEYDRWYA